MIRFIVAYEMFTAHVAGVMTLCAIVAGWLFVIAFVLLRRFLDTPFRAFLWKPRHVRYWVSLPGPDGWKTLRAFPGRHPVQGCRLCRWRGRKLR